MTYMLNYQQFIVVPTGGSNLPAELIALCVGYFGVPHRSRQVGFSELIGKFSQSVLARMHCESSDVKHVSDAIGGSRLLI
jgi:hypothetical protein